MAESAESAGSAAAADKPRKRVPPAGFTLRGRKSTDSLPNLSLGRSPSKEELLSTASPAAVSLAGHRLSLDGSERDEPTNATSQGPPDSGTPPSPFTASRMRNSATAAAAPAPPPGLQGVAPPPPPPAPPPRVGGQSDGLVAPRRRTFSSSPEEILSGMPEQRRRRREALSDGSVRMKRENSIDRDLDLTSMDEGGGPAMWLQQPSPNRNGNALAEGGRSAIAVHRSRLLSASPVQTTHSPWHSPGGAPYADDDGREYQWNFYTELGERCDSPAVPSVSETEDYQAGTTALTFLQRSRHRRGTRPNLVLHVATRPERGRNRRSGGAKSPGDLFTDIFSLDSDDDLQIPVAQPNLVSVHDSRVATALDVAAPRSAAPLICVVSTESAFPPDLQGLPDQCLQRILEHLGDLRSVCRCALVSRKMWQVVPRVPVNQLSFPLGLRLQPADATLALVQDPSLRKAGLVVEKRTQKLSGMVTGMVLGSLPPLQRAWAAALEHGVSKLDVSGYTQLGAIFLLQLRCAVEDVVDLEPEPEMEECLGGSGTMQLPRRLPGSPTESLQHPAILLAPRLLSMDLSYNTSLTALGGLELCSSLTTLKLKGCTQLNDLSALTALQPLQEIELAGCTKLRDLSPIGAVCHQVNLRRLGLSGCQRIRHVDVEPLKNCRGLEDLRMTGLEYLTALDTSASRPAAGAGAGGADLLSQAEHSGGSSCWPRLTKLQLSGCTHMDRIMPALGALAGSAAAVAHPSMLCELDLSFCAALTHLDFLEGCDALLSINVACCAKLECTAGLANCPKLNSVGMWGAARVSSVDSLSSCPMLRLLDCTAMPQLQPPSALVAVLACRQLSQAHFDEPIAKYIEAHISNGAAVRVEETASVLNGLLSPPRRQRRSGGTFRQPPQSARGAAPADKQKPSGTSRRRRGSIGGCVCGVRDEDSPAG